MKDQDEIKLIVPTEKDAGRIADYRDEFPADRMRVTFDPGRIPGMDHLEQFGSVSAWLQFCGAQKGRITWYMSVRTGDGKIVGFCCLRHRLEYDDDDPAFASHIGYSIRPSERKKGYGKEQLRLALLKAKEMGIKTVRLVCRDENIGSNRIIMANGGKFIDSIYGEESGLTVNRYDISLE